VEIFKQSTRLLLEYPQFQDLHKRLAQCREQEHHGVGVNSKRKMSLVCVLLIRPPVMIKI
jgi:hypothetical protein